MGGDENFLVGALVYPSVVIDKDLVEIVRWTVPMVFTGGTFFWLFLVFLSIWVIILTAVVIRLSRHYNKLTSGITKSGLRDILEAILQSQKNAQKQITDIQAFVSEIEKRGRKHIQKMSVVRFNPFHDTGGSQSFTMAILDGENSGFVMTSLFARGGNRWYVKEIHGGAGKDVALSKEEQMAIKLARPI